MQQQHLLYNLTKYDAESDTEFKERGGRKEWEFGRQKSPVESRDSEESARQGTRKMKRILFV